MCGEIIGSRNFRFVFKWEKQWPSPRAVTSCIPVAPVVPQGKARNVSSLTLAAPFFNTHSARSGKEMLQITQSPSYSRVSSCEDMNVRKRVKDSQRTQFPQKSRAGKKKRISFFSPFQCDFLFFCFTHPQSRGSERCVRAVWVDVFSRCLSLVVGVRFIFLGPGDVSCLSQQLEGVARRQRCGGK